MATALDKERRNWKSFAAEVQQVARWLEERQQQANIAGLYGE